MYFCRIHNMTKKISIILILLTICSVLITTEVKAIDEMLTAGKTFLAKGERPTDKISKDSLNSASNTIFKILTFAAIGVAVIVAAVLGFNFITGSVEGKAKIMESLMPYIAGCIVAFGAFGIWSVVVDTGDDIEGSIAITESVAASFDLEDEEEVEVLVSMMEEELRKLYRQGEINGLVYLKEDGEKYVTKYNAKQIFGEMRSEYFAEIDSEIYEVYALVLEDLDVEEFNVGWDKEKLKQKVEQLITVNYADKITIESAETSLETVKPLLGDNYYLYIAAGGVTTLDYTEVPELEKYKEPCKEVLEEEGVSF